jgi:hypothetical protein
MTNGAELPQLLDRWRALATCGIIVSICYGPLGGGVPAWTVQAMYALRGEAFDRPFHARNFAHCVEIAEVEARKRGWIPGKPSVLA